MLWEGFFLYNKRGVIYTKEKRMPYPPKQLKKCFGNSNNIYLSNSFLIFLLLKSILLHNILCCIIRCVRKSTDKIDKMQLILTIFLHEKRNIFLDLKTSL